ncbi:hypothetical protein NQ315_002740 [Exocentrus adspersus]|uniref:Uncharacterized protein n=1 Tax=Exocentrus adspersus TaxID=1586481 RepID=A0AAV8V6B3_9CUCU|nr:hypothetical protein NQ315_002740 [Exocentrus adspersus]
MGRNLPTIYYCGPKVKAEGFLSIITASHPNYYYLGTDKTAAKVFRSRISVKCMFWTMEEK